MKKRNLFLVGLAIALSLSLWALSRGGERVPTPRSEMESPGGDSRRTHPNPSGEPVPPPPAVTTAAATGAAHTPLDTAEQVKSVIVQNAAARDGITSYVMDIAWESRRFEDTPLEQPLPDGVVYTRGEGTWMWAEGKWRVEHRNRMETSDALSAVISLRGSTPLSAQAMKDAYSTCAVYNGEYFARKNSRAEFSLRYYPKEVLEAGFSYMSFFFPHPLEFGFGIGVGTDSLREIYDTSQLPALKPFTHWSRDTVQAQDGPKIRLTRSIPGNGTEIGNRTEFLIDPERDFLVVGWSSWELHPTAEKKTDEFTAELQQVAGGRWFPKDARCRRRDDYQRHVFSKVVFNSDIDTNMFNLESMPFDPARTRMIRKGVDRSEKAYLFRDGEWVPESLVPMQFRPARELDESGG